jgi:hypothetical protein
VAAEEDGAAMGILRLHGVSQSLKALPGAGTTSRQACAALNACQAGQRCSGAGTTN